MPTHSCNPKAELLKSQGNELYQKGQYEAAQRKFTDAIREDPTNAIYYANRAASGLALKEYLDAAADAIKATELDRNYAKAWSRLASATYGLASWSESVHAWEMALKCLPLQDQSSETEEKLRNQFTEGLKKSQKAMNTPQKLLGIYVKQGQKMPWEKAAGLIQEFANAQKVSSAFVILQAYREFREGVTVMKQTTRHYSNGMTTWLGKPDALVNITNGIMRDPRAFHIDCPDWIIKFNEQVVFEAQFFKAWVHGGTKTIKEEALELLKQKGWTSVRPALSTTIRAWLMCGLMATFYGQYQSSMEYYSRVADVLEWGFYRWQNVPTGDRGVIFERTFMRGIKRLQLSAMHTCITRRVDNLNFTIADMVEKCHQVITETDANPPPIDGELDVGFIASFWMYPKGDALSILGWYHMQLGHNAENAEDAQAAYVQSAKYYIEAAQSYPEDEEVILTFYTTSLEAYWYQPQGKTLADMFPLLKSITASLPNVLRIWEYSAAAQEGRDKSVNQAINFFARCNTAVREGKISIHSLVRPKEMKRLCKWGGAVVYV